MDLLLNLIIDKFYYISKKLIFIYELLAFIEMLLFRVKLLNKTNIIINTIRKFSHTNFFDVVECPKDSILGLNEEYKKDKSKNKVNLIVGSYRDENGKPYIFNTVRNVMNNLNQEDLEYTSMMGNQK